MESWSRLSHSVRYYRLGQILYRVLARAKNIRAPQRIRRLCARPGLKVRTTLPNIAEPVAVGPRLRFDKNVPIVRLLNREYAAGWLDSWTQLERQIPTRLGRFHLHYHEFFLPKSRDDDLPAPATEIWRLVDRWIEDCSLPRSRFSQDAWHPYVISRRIPVWVKLFSRFPPGGGTVEKVLASLTAQARWLRRNLEFDLGGNHLLQNLRGLAVAGAFLDGPEADGWLRTVEKLLRAELEEQILEDGEHFERSPMYHVDALLALADIREAFGTVFREWPGVLEDSIEKMANFLGHILHPDGQIPLFGDSTLDLTPNPRDVFDRLKMDFPVLQPENAESYSVGDYWVYRERGNFLIFDAGPVGPDHLPAHAHADLLTLEASWGGKRLFVDAGVYDYEDSAERAFCRSTAAHNTLQINGENQCDVWGRFRMGRRGRPGRLQRGWRDDFHWAACTHDAYSHLGFPEIGRLIVCIRGGPWVIMDWSFGRGVGEVTSRLRIPGSWHPVEGDELCIRLQQDHITVCVRPFHVMTNELRMIAGEFYPEFNRKEPAHVIFSNRFLPSILGWQVAEGDLEPLWPNVGERHVAVDFQGKQLVVFNLFDCREEVE